MAHPSFAPTFHPTFLRISHARGWSLTGALTGALTIIRLQYATQLPQSCKDTLRLGLDRPVRHAAYWRRIIKKKGGKTMPLFTIMYIYEIPARNQIAATDELMIARQNHFEKVFLKKVIVKDARQNSHGTK
jgi:hypothetical protein